MTRVAAEHSVILHLGLGAFHRAHQAAYLQKLIDRGDERWTLASGNIRPGADEIIDALRGQQGRYTLETVTPAGERRYHRIESIRRVIPWQEDFAEVVGLGSEPTTRIVSFTVTEAGYYLDAAGGLDTSHRDICADLASLRAGGSGTTIYGALAALLRERCRRRAGPLTLLCCDNLRHNGNRTRSGLLQFIEQLSDPVLLSWVRKNTTSPNAMVDRITPRPTAALRERVRAVAGIVDAAPVMCEDFAQWVIEDRFCNGRPDWERVGVQIVPSVAPYEEAKIRVLNASHSAIAWAGAVLGRNFIHEAAVDRHLRGWVHEYVDDVIECLEPSPVDLRRYRDVTLDRFGNAALMDTLERVVQDSHAKLGGFVAPTLRERLGRRQPVEGAALLPALYLAFLQHWRRNGLPFGYEDGALSIERARALTECADPVAALCDEQGIWGECTADRSLYLAIRRAEQRLAPMIGPRQRRS